MKAKVIVSTVIMLGIGTAIVGMVLCRKKHK